MVPFFIYLIYTNSNKKCNAHLNCGRRDQRSQVDLYNIVVFDDEENDDRS